MKDFIKKNKTVIILFILTLIIRIIAILIMKTPIESDFKTMYEASLELINGTNNYKDLIYFKLWGYQMGQVLYEYVLLSIINNAIFIEIINSIVSSFIVVFIYLISEKISNKKSALIVSVIYSIFLFPLLLNSVLTNQILPMLLILIALYLLILKKEIFSLKIDLIIGLLLSISNMLRSETIVIITAILLYYIYLSLTRVNIKKLVLSFVTIFITYTAIFNIVSFALIKTNISPNGLNNGNTYWKFVIGFNQKTNGMYSESDAFNYSSNKELSKKVAFERMKDIKNMPLLFLKKIKILWINSDLSWSLGYLNNNMTYTILNTINQIFIIVIDIISTLSIKYLFTKKVKKEQVLLSIILFVYFGVYLLIEVMPRYAYSLQVFQVILMSVVIMNFLNVVNKNKMIA